MASEITVRASLRIKNGNLTYSSLPSGFTADMAGAVGPAPGAFTATTAGTDVDLSQLGTPGVCRIMNLDATNYVTFGIWDALAGVFYPLGECLPGESWVFRLSRDIQHDYVGTGTIDAGSTKLRVKAAVAPCVVLVEAFSK